MPKKNPRIKDDYGTLITFTEAGKLTGVCQGTIWKWYHNEGIDTLDKLRHRATPEGKYEATHMNYKGSNPQPPPPKFNRNKVCYERENGNIVGRCKHYYDLTESFYPKVQIPKVCAKATTVCDNFSPVPLESTIIQESKPVKFYAPNGTGGMLR